MPKFLSSTEHNGDIIDINNNSGTAGQILSSLGSGNGIDWINQADITIGEADIAKTLQVTVKNVSGGQLTKGTVVHVSPSASPPSGNVIEVIAADYDDVAKMPAIGILKETIADEAEGEAVMSGALSGIATDGFTAGDELYVGADGALTNTKPQTAGQLIQKIAVCVKSHESNGLIKIFGAGRSNDVPLPLYIDNTNQRVGIGEPSPDKTLDVNGSVNIDGTFFVNAIHNHIRLIDTDSTANFSVGVNTNFQIRDVAANTTPLTISAGTPGNTIFTTDSGRVGIGLSNPGTALHVNGFTRINGGLQMNTANASIYQIQDSALKFGTNNTERMRIDSLGNVQFNSYGSGGITGTTAYNLAVDSSGNIIENSANTRSVFVATSTDTTTNINATTTIQWNSEDIKDSGYTHSDATNPEQITIIQAGTYKIYAAITYTTTVQRANVALQILVNDVATGARGAGGYVRSANNHNDGTTIVEDYVTVNANDVIQIQTSREANPGTVNLRSGESKIIIEKLTGLTLSTTDANTLGGLGAADFVAAAGDIMTGALTINEGGATIKKTNSSGFQTVLTVQELADEGSSQTLLLKNTNDRDVGIKFETGGGVNYIWQDSAGDDALIFTTGGNARATDAALILHQNQNVEIPNGNLTVSGNLTVGGDTMSGNLAMGGSKVDDAVIGFQNMGSTQGPSPDYNYKYFRITNDLTFDRNRIYELLIDAHPNAGYSGIYHIYISQHNNSGNHDRVRFHYVSGDKNRAELLVATDEHVWVRSTAKWGNVLIRAIYENEDVSSMPFDTTETRPATQAASTSDFVWNGDNNTFTDQEQWHAGNDGPGSGLDADTLDNQEGTYYLDYANFTSTPNLGTAAYSAATDFVAVTGDTMTGDLIVENSEIHVGDTSGDSFTRIKHAQADEYGFDWQHSNASVIVNEQGSTNQVLVLGDVDAADYSGLFGIAHSANAGVSWTKKLDLRGNGELYIGSSGTSRVFHDGYHPNADTWTTGRTITIGGTGKTVNGSANVSWTLSEIGAAASSHNHDSDYVNVTGDTMTGTLSINRSGSGQIILNNRAHFGTHYDNNNVWIYGGAGDTILLGGGIGGIQNDVNVGNGDLIVPNGNVGIGVTSPSSILDISDAITGDDSQFRITNGAGATLRMGITGNGANQAAHIKTNSSENLEFHIGQASNSATPKVIFTADGDVGIGTDNPGTKLSVNGGSDNLIAAFSSTDDVAQIEIVDHDTSTYVGSKNGLSYISQTAGTPADGLVVNSSGDVGIGTTNPIQKLHVLGSGYINAGSLFIDSGQRLKWGNSNQWIEGTNDTSLEFSGGGGGTQMILTSDGDVGIGTTTLESKLHVVSGAGEAGFLSRAASGDTWFPYTNGQNYVRGVTNFDLGSVYFTGGNVGIGTTSSSQRAVISGPNTSPSLNTTAVSNASLLISNSNTGYGTYFATTGGGIGLIQQRRQTSAVYYDLALQPFGGNVGIGTASPNYMLHLGGSAVGAVNGQLAFGDVANVPSGLIQGYRVDGSYKGELRFLTSTSAGTVTQRMVIDEDGYVGIGTTDPGAKLQINNASTVGTAASALSGLNPILYLDAGQAAGRSIVLKNHTSGNNTVVGALRFAASPDGTNYSHASIEAKQNASAAVDTLEFRTSSSNTQGTTNNLAMIIEGTDVGIGTTSPSLKLDVVDANASRTWSHYSATVAAFERNGDSIVNIVSGNTGNASLWFGRSNSMVRGRIRYEQGNDKMELWTTNSPKAYIDSSGNFHAIADVVAYSSSVSDIRLKDNINTIDSALDKVKKLRGVEYTWNAGSRKNKKDLGVIAQEVEEVLPDIVREHKMDFIDEQVYKTVDYEKITAVLIEAIKEQQKQIDELKNQLNAFTK